MGSDLRQWGNTCYLLSYMTQLGGWSLMDAALYYSENPAEDMRTAYASYMAGWSLIHTGESYPWYPSSRNEGAAGWGYEPSRKGNPWIGARFFDRRGPWPIDGEIDNGFSGGLRTAAGVLVNDPIFGLYFYGGSLNCMEDGIFLTPGDGLQQRLHLLHTKQPVHLEVLRDGILSAHIRENEIVLHMKNRTHDTHLLTIVLESQEKKELIYSVCEKDTYQIAVPLMENTD